MTTWPDRPAPRGFCPWGETQQQGCLLAPGHDGPHLPSDPPEADDVVHPTFPRPRRIDTTAAPTFDASFMRRLLGALTGTETTR